MPTIEPRKITVVGAGYVALREGPDATRWLRLDDSAPGGRRSDLSWIGEEGAESLAGARERIVDLDAAIRSADISLNPVDENRCGADRCAFADLCRFDGGGV